MLLKIARTPQKEITVTADGEKALWTSKPMNNYHVTINCRLSRDGLWRHKLPVNVYYADLKLSNNRHTSVLRDARIIVIPHTPPWNSHAITY